MLLEATFDIGGDAGVEMAVRAAYHIEEPLLPGWGGVTVRLL